MNSPLSPEQPRKRRAINACVSCRSSKVRCDGRRPCGRCEKNDTACRYYDAVKDEHTMRIEKLEESFSALRDEISQIRSQSNTALVQQTFAPILPDHLRQCGPAPRAVDAGLITWDQAASWFQSFFSGSQYLVPIFCSNHVTLMRISSCSPFLFDSIVSIGCRAEEGFSSPTYRQLQSRVREHLTSLLIDSSVPSLEDVQAVTLMAAYSENGFVLIALAMRFAIQLGLPDAMNQLMAYVSRRPRAVDASERTLYRSTRVWLGICNFELFFSLDGGKLPSTALQTSPRKIRTLANHPERTPVDVRLLSQVELNIIRSDAYRKIVQRVDSMLPQNESTLQATIDDTGVELSLWLDEWTAIISTEPLPHERSLALQNLHIQREWALMTLSLKAIAVSGIENIAIMTEFQRSLVIRAKEAAARHLHHILSLPISSSPPYSPSLPGQSHKSTYLSTFKWTLDYVWAKCAFSVLIVLKLAILLRDPVASVMSLLRDAHRLLEKLKSVTVGHIAYFQILQTSVEKCEAALREYVTQQSSSVDLGGAGGEESMDGSRAAEEEFQGYVPSEFVFEWDFPGLNLKHMPLGWQDLFINIDGLF
ncbi:hypothetical protein K458DRAFT_376031 [Lentithecium fluviatile CBS 122367]|uniref:Zn(2)-C6 fungal-type domain-containing protein n=1 Tax=Lentithecium fluviatile CBS 122367 TaxID=1168545 RepID=A0A6G1IKX0_9PLEO|nr:hypothetical protein K458DRAFT_376031 [Lentithecium fluviatile CBS 122367]